MVKYSLSYESMIPYLPVYVTIKLTQSIEDLIKMDVDFNIYMV